MSQHSFTDKNYYNIMYGLDKPTGGYYWQKFDDEDNVLSEADGLTLTELLDYLEDKETAIPLTELIKDFLEEDEPTPLQINVGKMFGKDIVRSLESVKEDVNNQMDSYAHGMTLRTPYKN